MENIFTAKQIAAAVGVNDRTIRTRANKDNWPSVLKPGRGGQIPHYIFASLPSDIRTALNSMQSESGASLKGANAGKMVTKNKTVDREIALKTKQESLAEFAGINGKQRDRALAKFNILNGAKNHQRNTSLTKIAAFTQFCEFYNSKDDRVAQYQSEFNNTVSLASIIRWEKTLNKNGITALAGNYGKTKGKGIIDSTPELKEYCIALIHEYPHIKGERLADMLEAEFIQKYTIPAASTCRAWLSSWKDENQALYMSMFDPSAWQNKRMVAFGDMSIDITRINQLWEFDSTPADVMLKDGRYNIVGVIDVFTRRVKLVLKPTSNAEGIALLIRHAILDWGLPEVARTDNGSDYLSHHISTVWNSLDIHNDITNPYSGWEKPFIERFFRTFSHGIAELLQGYIGHNVVDRERISSRLTFAEKLVERKEKGAERVGIDVSLTAKEFETKMNQWVDHHYHHSTHSGIKCTPFEQYTRNKQSIRRVSSERVLDVLLSPVPGNGFRTVTKSNGISIEGGSYIHAELGAYIGDRVFCRWNPQDVGKIFVFHALHGHFICEAVNPEIAGQDITMAHAMEAKKIQRAQLTEQRRHFKSLAKKHDVSDAAQTYLDYRTSQTGGLSAFPKASTTVETTATKSAESAIESQIDVGYTEAQLSEFEQRRKQLQEIHDLENSPSEPVFNNDHHKARYLTERQLQATLSVTEATWLSQYRRDHTAAARMLDKLINPAAQTK